MVFLIKTVKITTHNIGSQPITSLYIYLQYPRGDAITQTWNWNQETSEATVFYNIPPYQISFSTFIYCIYLSHSLLFSFTCI